MDSENRIVKAKVKMQRENPFFSYLVMNLKIIEKEEIGTMGVDNKGNCYYNSEFIETLSDQELRGVLTHEVLHVVFEHLTRGQELENQIIMNVACDMCINNILVENNFSLPSCNGGSLIPYNNHCDFQNIRIDDISEKTAVQIYHELLKKMKEEEKDGDGEEDEDGNGKSRGQVDYNGFDKHITTADTKDTPQILRETKDKWKNNLASASMLGRQKGDTPQGMDLMIDELLNPKVNWKTLLYRYLTSVIPFDYTYNRPSKRSISSGFYMPSILRESVEIVISIDTSGSIQKDELTAFMSEINSMLNSFSNINIKLIVCDSEIKDIFSLGNGQEHDIDDIIFRGGGGTSFKTPLNYIQKNLQNTQLVIFFTDGYADEIKRGDYPFNLLWVLTENSTDKYIKDSGEVITLN